MNRLIDFFKTRIWTIRLSSLPKLHAARLVLCRVVSLTWQFFLKNSCALRASALTYFTLLSIVPVAALIFGIAKGYGMDAFMKKKLQEGMVGQERVAERIISFAESAIENASGGLIAGIGVVVLLWTALKLLSNIELSFNAIWGVKQGRSLFRKLSDYFTMLVFFPLMIIIVVSSAAFVGTRLQNLLLTLPFSETSVMVLACVTKVLPVVLAWGVLTFMYLFIPNTKVRIRPALTAGFFAGVMYVVVQYAYMYLQGLLSGYNAIYGSFAALPFFLLWLQTSWLIVLLGAQIAFAMQNVNIYELAPGDFNPSLEYASLCALRIMRFLSVAMEEHRGPQMLEEISEGLEIPIRVTRGVLYDLQKAGMVAETGGDTKEGTRFLVSVPSAEITPTAVCLALMKLGDFGYLPAKAEEDRALLAKLWKSAETSPVNRPLGKK